MPIDLADCRPGLDVRRLVRLEYDGRAITSTRDLAGLPSDGHRGFALQFLAAMCDRRVSPLQELAQYYGSPVTIEVPEECHEPSFYMDTSRTITLSSFAPCAGDSMPVLYHEMTHVIVADHLLDGLTIWDGASYCFADSHDDRILDPADHTLLNVMDSESNIMRAMDEGVADGVSLAFAPDRTRLQVYLSRLRNEARSTSWRQMSWRSKQANEFFVAAVIADYLGTEPAARRARLGKLVAAGRARPRDFQGLLRALADADPVDARGRIDAVLARLNAGWDSERDEVMRLRAREGR